MSAAEHRGRYDGAYLPHWDAAGAFQAITYRLADSLPADVVARMESELELVDAHEVDSERRRRLDRLLDAGRGSCVLARPEAAEVVVETWRRFDPERYDLVAWVVMPNHVHVLIRVREGHALSRIIQSWKSYTGRQIAALVRVELGLDAPRSAPIWMREYWDRAVRDERHFENTIRYNHANPVAAGLVEDAVDWPWSSAALFAERGVI